MAHTHHTPRRDRRDDSFLRRFAREYGWRAYAIPILAVITVWVLVDMATGTGQTPDSGSSVVASDNRGGHKGVDRGQGPDPAKNKTVPPNIEDLPEGGPYTQTGKGSYHEVGAKGAKAGEGKEQKIRYVVEVEDGVDTAGIGGDDALSRIIDATLTDPRGWTHDPRFSFEHVGAGDNPNMRIQLTSVDTTHKLCGADLKMETNCRNNADNVNRIVVNVGRWTRGANPFQGDLGTYRQYLINHEVGHGLGYASHEPCGQDGALAPIMMQQTLSLSNSELHNLDPNEVYQDDHKVCRTNGWPYPPGGGETGQKAK